MQTFTIVASSEQNGWWVKTAGGNKIFPSVGVASYQACERWIQDNSPAIRDEDQTVEVPNRVQDGQKYTIMHDTSTGDCWVLTEDGTIIFPSFGRASKAVCERWIQDNSPAIRDEDQTVEVPNRVQDGAIRMLEQDCESIERWSEIDEITWIEYQIFDNVGRLKHLDPNHPIVLSIRTMLNMYPHVDKSECG